MGLLLTRVEPRLGQGGVHGFGGAGGRGGSGRGGGAHSWGSAGSGARLGGAGSSLGGGGSSLGGGGGGEGVPCEVCGKRVPFGPALELHMAQHERAGDVHRLREQQARLVEYPPGPVRA